MIIDGFIISLNTYYQSKELEVLFTSPVNRTSLFFSRLFETHLKTSWMLIIFGIPLLVSLGLQFNANITYYFYSLLLFIAFSTIPVNVGISATIMLSGIFHIKKLKKFMFSAGIITVIVIVTLLRIFRPERFVNPELFANLKIFLSGLKTPSFILLPSRWLSESLFNFLNKNYSDIFIFISLLFLTSYITVFFLIFIYKRYHYKGWSLLQGGSISLKEKRRHFSHISNFVRKGVSLKPVQLLLPSLDSQSITLLIKDLLYQFHDIKNIQQNLVLLSLIIIYLFSIASLPLNWVEYGIELKYVISFFNLGLILIIIASLCSKLVYPAIVSEGNSLWLIKTSPITPKKYIWTKFFFLFIPIFLLGQLLTIFSLFFIDIGKTLFALNILTTTLLCFSLVSMAIAFSISDLKKTTKEGESEEIKTGSTIYMVISVFFILFTLALEIIPIYLYFLRETAKIEFIQKTWFLIGAVVFILLFVNALVTAISMHISIKRFDNIQLS
jgi:ABC-2 type transport system permease protein